MQRCLLHCKKVPWYYPSIHSVSFIQTEHKPARKKNKKKGKFCQTGKKKTLKAQIVPLRHQLFMVSVKVCGRRLHDTAVSITSRLKQNI